MFGFLKNLLRRSGNEPEEAQGYDAGENADYTSPAPSANGRRNQVSARRSNGNGNGYGHGNGQAHAKAATNGKSEHQKMVEIPLPSILPGLPLEVQPFLQTGDFFDAVVPVPLERILAQLSRGSVKISFGELRSAVPEAFADDASQDKVLVPLPLGEVLSRLNPALIQRRRTQRTVEVPADISSPFDPESQGLIFSVGPGKEAAPAATPTRQTAPLPPTGPARKSIVSTATPPPPGAPTAHSTTTFLRPGKMAPVPETPRRPAMPAAPAPQAAPAMPISPAIPMAAAPAAVAPVPAPAAVQPAAVAPAPASGEPEVEPLLVQLIALAENWPDSVRKEIVELRLVEARVALPTNAIELGLRQGRIAFSWKVLRSWIHPAPLPSVSVHDSLVLELPLKIVAPLFLVRQKETAKEHNRVAIDAEIPNLFFGSPQNELQDERAVTKPADTNYYVWDDTGDTARVDLSEVKRAAPSLGTQFVAKYATPNEIVSRAAALEGVAGVIIALPDGLMVANSVPPDLNPDTVAAFLPHIFGKVSQCTKELRMGELNNLNFTVGNVPWKIFRVNAIFFAAFGHEGQGLPTGRLTALAAELDHKPK